MIYGLEIPEKLDRIFAKLAKKDRKTIEIINNKIKHILDNPYQFKPLKNDLAGTRRVHIGKSFVLIYEILENIKTVRILDYNHHETIFKK